MKWNRYIVVFALCFAFAWPASAFRSWPKKNAPHVVFLISEDPDNYEAHKTIPAFAASLRDENNFDVTVLLGKGAREAYRFPNLEVLGRADLLVIFCRRLALPHDQMKIIKDYLKAGKPVVGLRTANHAFSVRDEVQPGFEDWWDFVPEILGCENKGYGPVAPGTDVAIVNPARNHPVLKGIKPAQWHSNGNVYLVAPLLDKDAKILLTGTAENKTEPIAWTRITEDNSRVFYTSLGYPDDFAMAPF
jgi:type 1 glutamine amidotransferase